MGSSSLSPYHPRVRILDSRMVHIDRQQKCCILHDGQGLGWVQQRGKLGPAMELMTGG